MLRRCLQLESLFPVCYIHGMELLETLLIILAACAAVFILGYLLGRYEEKKKHEDPASGWPRRQVCYYASNQQIWQIGRPMSEGMLVSLTPGGEPLEVHIDTHFYVIDPKTDERVWLIYG